MPDDHDAAVRLRAFDFLIEQRRRAATRRAAKTSATNCRAWSRLPWLRESRARLVVARSSRSFARWRRATSVAVWKHAWACSSSGAACLSNSSPLCPTWSGGPSHTRRSAPGTGSSSRRSCRSGGTGATEGSRRRIRVGSDTYLVVILTTRILPPIVVIIAIFIMFRVAGLSAGAHLAVGSDDPRIGVPRGAGRRSAAGEKSSGRQGAPRRSSTLITTSGNASAVAESPR
jgi:hypothetical protein